MPFSHHVHQCLNQMQLEIDELTPSDEVMCITSQWGLAMRPQSNALLLSRKNHKKRKDLAKQKSKRLHRRLNPPPSQTEILLPRFQSILTDLLPGDPSCIMAGLGIKPPPILLEKFELMNNLAAPTSIFSVASCSLNKNKNSVQQRQQSQQSQQTQRDPKHYKLVQDARKQQHKLREGIARLQDEVQKCLDVIGRTKDDNNLALRIAHEATQTKLEKRKHEISKDVPKPNSQTNPLWLLPILALETVLKSTSVAKKTNPFNVMTDSYAAAGGGGGNKQYQQNQVSVKQQKLERRRRQKQFRKMAVSARGLTVGLSVAGFGRSLYSLSKDAGIDRYMNDEDDDDNVKAVMLHHVVTNGSHNTNLPLKKKLAKLDNRQSNRSSTASLSIDFTKRFLKQRLRRGNIGAPPIRSSTFRLSETMLRRFEFELLQEDRTVSQILCHIWLTTTKFAAEHSHGKSADPFTVDTIAAALQQLVNNVEDLTQRKDMERDLVECWRIVTSSRIFREHQLRHKTSSRTVTIQNQQNHRRKKQQRRPQSAHAGTKNNRRAIISNNNRASTFQQRGRKRPSTAQPSGRSSTGTTLPKFIPTSDNKKISSTTILRKQSTHKCLQTATNRLRFRSGFGEYLHETRSRLKMSVEF